MSTRHDIRRLAMQLLYQFDLRGQEDAQQIRDCLEDSTEPPELCRQGFELAQAVWERHDQADAAASALAPHWPTHRQPPLDRAILRLAYYEMVTGRVPNRVAINEAIVLAKQYCSEQSPGFINGVLDKIAKQLDNSPARDTADEPGLTQAGDGSSSNPTTIV